MSTLSKNYINIINNNTNLDQEEEFELIKQAQNGDKNAKEKLFNCYLELVVGIARKYATYPILEEDLIQEGLLGLEDILKVFNPEKNRRFSAPAKFWIKSRILQYMEENMRTFSIPSNTSCKILKISKTIEKLNKENNHNPSNKEIGNYLGYTEGYVSFLRKFLSLPISIDVEQCKYENSNSLSIKDLIEDDRNIASESCIINDGVDKVRKSINLLPEIQRKVIKSRYGLNGDEKTLKEVGKELNLTAERVRQIQVQAENKLLFLMGRK